MMLLISQILGCLFVAAGIGGVIGWLLQYLSSRQLIQQCKDVTATLRLKEQRLEKAQYELKVHVASMQLLESKALESDTLVQSTKQELLAQDARLLAVQEELAARTQELRLLEAEDASLRRRAPEPDAAAPVQMEETQPLHPAGQTAKQTLEANEQEPHDYLHHAAELDAALAEIARLRARVEELEPAQGRVHWLEVQLCDRDTEHRAALHQRDNQLAERDRRIGELERLQPQLNEQEAALTEREMNLAHTISQHEAQIAKLHKQLATQEHIKTQLLRTEQLLHERDERIDGLQRKIQEFEAQKLDLVGQAKLVAENEEEITRLRKRLVEVRAALRIKADAGTTVPRQTRQNGSQLSLQIEQTNAAKEAQKDDLSKIHGIGPAFAKTLNKMGWYTFGQIAKWTPEDVAKAAKKLYTAPDRIKRDNWIEEAKKEHFRKYGERL